MIDSIKFREWLSTNTDYSTRVINDYISRVNRADKLLSWQPTTTYIFYLEKEPSFFVLSASVKSQLRKALKMYESFYLSSQK
jgi:DNA (cytosine-5)-methyltransferase 1